MASEGSSPEEERSVILRSYGSLGFGMMESNGTKDVSSYSAGSESDVAEEIQPLLERRVTQKKEGKNFSD